MEGGPPRLSPAREEGTAACGVCPQLWRLHRAGTGSQKLPGLLSQAGATARDARAASGDYLTRCPCHKPRTHPLASPSLQQQLTR